MIFISDAVETITGYPPSDFLIPNPRRSFADVYHPDEKEYLCSFTSPDAEYTNEYRIIHRNGEVRWVLENGHYIYDDNDEVKWIDGFIMDITERKFIEQEYLNAKNRAEAAAASRSEFLTNMSHEIRTPLNAILGYAQLIGEDNQLVGVSRTRFLSIASAGERLLALINEILDIARIETGRLVLHGQKRNLCREVSTVRRLFLVRS